MEFREPVAPDLPCHEALRDDPLRLPARLQHGVREHSHQAHVAATVASPMFRRTSSVPNSSAADRYSGRRPGLEPQKTQIRFILPF